MEIANRLERAIGKAGSLKEFAKLCGVSSAYVCAIRKGNKAAGPKVLAQLGIERRVTYRRKVNGS